MSWFLTILLLVIFNALIWAIPVPKWGHSVSHFIVLLLGFPFMFLIRQTGTDGNWVPKVMAVCFVIWSARHRPPQKGFDWYTPLVLVLGAGLLVFIYFNGA